MLVLRNNFAQWVQMGQDPGYYQTIQQHQFVPTNSVQQIQDRRMESINENNFNFPRNHFGNEMREEECPNCSHKDSIDNFYPDPQNNQVSCLIVMQL